MLMAPLDCKGSLNPISLSDVGIYGLTGASVADGSADNSSPRATRE